MKSHRRGKGGQAQIIVTVLLILIVLAAVALLSGFVFKLIKDNLQGTDCFKTVGQLEFNSEYTYFNDTNNVLFVSITREDEQFNLSGMVVSISDGPQATPYKIISGAIPKNFTLNPGTIVMYNGRFGLEALQVPEVQETMTYEINLDTKFTKVEEVSVAAIVGKDKTCKFSDALSVTTIN
jgi:hypothetical protein